MPKTPISSLLLGGMKWTLIGIVPQFSYRIKLRYSSLRGESEFCTLFFSLDFLL